MKISVTAGEIQQSQADTIIVNLFEGVSEPGGATGAVDEALGSAITDLIQGGDLTGKAGEITVLYPRGAIPARRVLVAGLGSPEAFDLEAVRKASAAAIVRARDLKARRVASIVHGSGIGRMAPGAAAQAVVEGALLALYQYRETKKPAEPVAEIETFTLVEKDLAKIGEIEAGARLAETAVNGALLARELVNLPPNLATPSRMAQTAREIAEKYHYKLTVGDRAWATERKMGAFLAVAQGAKEPPQFIVLEHNAGRTDLPTVVLVGKGITFDSGGISIKPSEKMGDMKSDMAGAAAVLGTMQVVGELDLPLRVIGITPCTENLPDGGAYRPADVVTASNGKTIEIISTDAEGRLILADALVYAAQYEPAAVIDLATLTGACVIALGNMIAGGLFANDDALAEKLLASGQATHELLWRLPLWDEYKKAIRSDSADIKNTGGRNGGVGTSAIFLKEFTSYPWAHLDIAGMALADKASAYIPVGGTGYGVRLLVDLLRNW